MADVFISFSSKDAERVARIHANLLERGFDVWWMQNLLPGDSPIKAVSRELTAAKNVVLAWSRYAEESPYVEGEIMHAFGERKLLPVRLEKWSWPAFLSSVQYVDMTSVDEEPEAWRQIETRLRQQARTDTPHAPTPLVAAPRSAGPVRTLAVMMLVLVLVLIATLAVGYQAIRADDLQLLQFIRYGVLALPVISGALVLVAAQRVWNAWRSRPVAGGAMQ
jgi:hypothetical protein